jgi:hypothetical protein
MKVDMSSRAVTMRLKRVSQMRRLCVALGRSRPVEAAISRSPQERTGSSATVEAGDETSVECGGSGFVERDS